MLAAGLVKIVHEALRATLYEGMIHTSVLRHNTLYISYTCNLSVSKR